VKKSKKEVNIFLIILILFIIGFLLFNQQGFTGKPIYPTEFDISQDPSVTFGEAKLVYSKNWQYCVEEIKDDGKNYEKYGKIKTQYKYKKSWMTKENTEYYEDYCLDENNLREYFCYGKKLYYLDYECESGCDKENNICNKIIIKEISNTIKLYKGGNPNGKIALLITGSSWGFFNYSEKIVRNTGLSLEEAIIARAEQILNIDLVFNPSGLVNNGYTTDVLDEEKKAQLEQILKEKNYEYNERELIPWKNERISFDIHNIYVYQIEDPKDIFNIIKQIPGEINYLVIELHGSIRSLGNLDNELDTRDLAILSEDEKGNLRNKFSDDAIVLLTSCEVSKGYEGGDNNFAGDLATVLDVNVFASGTKTISPPYGYYWTESFEEMRNKDFSVNGLFLKIEPKEEFVYVPKTDYSEQIAEWIKNNCPKWEDETLYMCGQQNIIINEIGYKLFMRKIYDENYGYYIRIKLIHDKESIEFIDIGFDDVIDYWYENDKSKRLDLEKQEFAVLIMKEIYEQIIL